MSSILLMPQTPPEIASRGAQVAKSGARPTFALYTLGCKVNQYDSHQIARSLVAKGFRRVEFRESADLYVIDTCTVTAQADKKSRQAASRARRNNPDAVVAVTGCAATKDALQFERAAPGALVLSNAQKWELPERALERLGEVANWAQNYADFRAQTGSEPVPSPTRERAVLKIQDGCNHKCSYCIIPRVRGASVVVRSQSGDVPHRAQPGAVHAGQGRQRQRHAVDLPVVGTLGSAAGLTLFSGGLRPGVSTPNFRGLTRPC